MPKRKKEYNLVIPGRAPFITLFQTNDLQRIMGADTSELEFLLNAPSENGKITSVTFLVTDANMDNWKDSPVPFKDRYAQLQLFGSELQKRNIGFHVVDVNHYARVDHWVDILVNTASRYIYGEERRLDNQNTIFYGSTPAIIDQFQKKGFAVLGAELESLEPLKYKAITPWKVLENLIAIGPECLDTTYARENLPNFIIEYLKRNEHVLKNVRRTFKDPLTGLLDWQRNYSTYNYDMANPAVRIAKHAHIKEFIVNGTVVDDGCADGSLLQTHVEYLQKIGLTSAELGKITLIGVDNDARMIQLAYGRHASGGFRDINTQFITGNVMMKDAVGFKRDTTISSSMIHHIFTFGDKYKSVMDYFRLVFENTNENGTFLIQDPVAPDRPDETVYLLLNKEDGSNEDWNRHFEIDQPEMLDAHLKGLSTYARFKRFSQDYLTNNKNFSSRWKVRYEEKTIDGQEYIAVKRKHAAEFMARKDWTDSWMSEMRECFTFWTHDEWKQALEDAGWTIEGKNNDPKYGTNVRTDPYKIPRWEGKVEMYEMREGVLQKSDLPYTNQTLIARKITDRITI